MYLNQVIFFFGAVGVFNSFLLSIYFIISKNHRELSTRLFGWFLLVLNYRILKSLFYAYSPKEPVWFLQTGPSLFLLIGPLLITYLSSKTNLDSVWVRYRKYHIVFWVLVVFGLLLMLPFSKNVELNKQLVLPLVNLQWLLYIVGSAILVFRKIEFLQKEAINGKWLIWLLAVTAFLWILFFLLPFDYFEFASLLFSMLFYGTSLYFFFNKRKQSIVFPIWKKVRLGGSTQEPDRLITELCEWMKLEKPYLNPDLNSYQVAEKLMIPKHELSKLLNGIMGVSFVDLVNEYRVEEAKQLIQGNTRSKYTIEAIGNQSGFKSKSAFYKAFKKFVGLTPAKYSNEL